MRDGTCSSFSAGRPWLAGHALQRTLQGPMAERTQSSPPREELHALKRTLMEGASELHQSSFCNGDPPAEASAQAGRLLLRIIQDPIARLNPQVLYRQVQFVVEEGDWTRQGEEVSLVKGKKS
ncbi:MAG: hypothetical protein KatS3mg015_3145 [Fimbriimonadales bacterium]|nr:MAG: hypothetical protein KatS3mg015_3145 [Fimbriimonadales bacterium]